MALPSSLLAHLTFLPTPSADFLPTLYETTASTILAFLSLSPGSEANATTWAGAANGYWQSALVNHPAFLGFGGGFLGGLCFAFRVLAYICIGPFAFLILLDLCGYVIARTLHIPSQRVRVRTALNKAKESPTSDLAAASQPLPTVDATSSGISTAINIHPPKTATSTEDREVLLRTLSTSSSSSSVSSGFGGGGGGGHRERESSTSSSSSGALGLEGTGVMLGPVIGGGGVSSSVGGKQAGKGRRVPKGLSISPIAPSEPIPSIHSYPSPSPGSSSSAASSRSCSPSRYMTTPGERHAVLPPSRDRSPSPTSIPLPPDDDHDHALERRRRRAASIGVEGALGLNDDEDSEEDEEDKFDGDDKSGALRRRRGTIRPTQRGT